MNKIVIIGVLLSGAPLGLVATSTSDAAAESADVRRYRELRNDPYVEQYVKTIDTLNKVKNSQAVNRYRKALAPVNRYHAFMNSELGKKYSVLRAGSDVKRYLQVVNSSDVQNYRALDKNSAVKHYRELAQDKNVEKYVQLLNKKSPKAALYLTKSSVREYEWLTAQSNEVNRFRYLSGADDVKDYLRLVDSPAVRNYEKFMHDNLATMKAQGFVDENQFYNTVRQRLVQVEAGYEPDGPGSTPITSELREDNAKKIKEYKAAKAVLTKLADNKTVQEYKALLKTKAVKGYLKDLN